MASNFIGAQVRELFQGAAQAIKQTDWAAVAAREPAVLGLDPDNGDAPA